MSRRDARGHLLSLCLLTVCLLTAAVGCAARPRADGASGTLAECPVPRPPEEGTASGTDGSAARAPDFTVLDAEGRAERLSDYVGRPVVVNFWATWCPPCRRELPDFEAAYRKYGDRVQFLIVDLTDGRRDTVESAGRFVRDNGYTFPVRFDADGSAARAYRIVGIPNTYFIRSDGSVAARAMQMIDAETLERGIAMILE